MIGPLELVLTAAATAVGGAVGVGWFLIRRGREPAPPGERPPLPLLPLLLSLVPVMAAIPVGLLAGGILVEVMLDLVPPLDTALFVSRSGSEVTELYLHAAGLVAIWLALPGLLGGGWLLVSRERSWRWALVLGVAGWIGGSVGLAFGASHVAALVAQELHSPIGGLALSAEAFLSPFLAGVAGWGVVGASGPVAWVLAASSVRCTIRALLWTAAMPAGALFVAALTTPPDVLTQLAVAILIGGSWLAGLGAGAVTARLRRGRRGVSE